MALMMTLSSKLRRSGTASPPDADRGRLLKELVRNGEWRKAAQMAGEMGDDTRLVQYALRSGLGRLPDGALPDPQRAAEILARQGAHEEAILLFERAQSFNRAGESALALQQLARAGQFFKQARAWEQSARCFEEAGELREALNVLETGEKRIEQGALVRSTSAEHGRVERLKLRRAEILLRLGRSDLAATLLGSLPVSPRSAELLEAAGRHEEALQRFLELGRTDEAMAVAARSPQRERLQAKIHLHAGRPVEAGDLFARLGHAQDAAEAYEAGGEWSRAAYRWEAARDPQRAAEAYEKAGRLRDAARCFMAANQPLRAAEMRDKAASGAAGAATPAARAAGSQLMKARQHLAAGETVEAVWILMRMAPEEPGFAEGCLLLAPLLLEARFYKEALDRLHLIAGRVEPAIVQDRDYWEARCFEALERTEEALAAYGRVLARDPGYREGEAWQRSERLKNPVVAELEPVVPGGLPIGSRLAGRYEIVAELGRGGMGRVYKAHDHDLGETVAIKTVLTSSEGGVGDDEPPAARGPDLPPDQPSQRRARL